MRAFNTFFSFFFLVFEVKIARHILSSEFNDGASLVRECGSAHATWDVLTCIADELMTLHSM